jgi:hypothetical protein
MPNPPLFALRRAQRFLVSDLSTATSGRAAGHNGKTIAAI